MKSLPIYRLHLTLIILFVFSSLYAQRMELYLSREDILLQKNVSSLDIINVHHYKAYYGKKNEILHIDEYDAQGQLLSKEIYRYSSRGDLVEKQFLNSSGKAEKIIRWGQNKFIREFLKKMYETPFVFRDDRQGTHIYLDSLGHTIEMQFYSSSGKILGGITYQYDSLGNKTRETWYTGNKDKVFDEFYFQYDSLKKSMKITEMDGKGNIISEIEMATPKDWKLP